MPGAPDTVGKPPHRCPCRDQPPARTPLPSLLQAKAGAGSATLAMAAAGARFAASCLRAMAGEGGVEECAFVASSLVSGLPFLASPLRLGPDGIAGGGGGWGGGVGWAAE